MAHLGRSSDALRMQHDEADKTIDTADWRKAKLVCGVCCMPECKVLRGVALATAAGDEITHELVGGFVVTRCTNGKCTHSQLHAECYDKIFDTLQNFLGHTWRSGSAKAKSNPKTRRAAGGNCAPHEVWSGTNYEHHLRTHCRCVCGNGFFCVVLDERGEVERRGLGGEVLTTSSAAADERKLRLETELAQQQMREREQRERERETRRKEREENARRKAETAAARAEEQRVREASRRGINLSAVVYERGSTAAAAAAAVAAQEQRDLELAMALSRRTAAASAGGAGGAGGASGSSPSRGQHTGTGRIGRGVGRDEVDEEAEAARERDSRTHAPSCRAELRCCCL